ncbi:MAG: AAA family ATPase [Candidatus Micrarchaeota archaeon]
MSSKESAPDAQQPWGNTAAGLKPEEIDFNDEFSKAMQLMEGTGDNVLVTGKAGTGKSTLLSYFTTKTGKQVAVLAPTGVAAVNVGGQTIHSFFGFKPDITPNKIKKAWGERITLYAELDALVIDEASMVRADLLDCMDKSLRLNRGKKNEPFGGVQMIFFGDLYQLPPVVTGKERDLFREHYGSPYFFDSKAFSPANFGYVELEKIYRQKDDSFISLLNAIRNNTVGENELRALNRRCLPQSKQADDGFCVTLTTTNDLADGINEQHLSSLKTPAHEFKAVIKGGFKEGHCPAGELLRVKKGAQIMMLNNDAAGRWVNGTVGEVTGFGQRGEKECVNVVLQNGFGVEVTPHTWTVFEYFYNEGRAALDSRTIGSFTQIPMKLAWAVTIHKSQGKTFDRVHVNLGRGTFTPGQLYVALSRCRTLQGITLEKPVEKKHVFTDWRVVKFTTSYQYGKAEEQTPLKRKTELVEEAIENKTPLEIVYLKASDVKSKRTVQPLEVGEMEYMGKKYLGMKAFCFKRQAERVFRLDRILEITSADKKSSQKA